MKILLIDTKHWYGSSYTYPRGAIPFALLCVATYLKERGKDVEIVDINASDIDYADLPQIIREKRPSIVGVPSSMTMYIPDSFRICKIAKSVDPDIITLPERINFTAATEFYMKRCPELDFVVRGDGEPTSLELLEALENGEKDFHKIKGLAWREEGGILVNSERFVEDMDSLPFPNWDLLNLDKYHLGIFPSSWGKQAMFTLARGCPYNCNFCVAKRGQGKYRPPSVEWAIESISRLRYKYGRRMLYINDLCFGANDEWAENFFEKVVEKGIDINMCLDMRTDEVIRQKRLLPLMRKAGARIIAMGVESPLEKDEIFYAKKTGGNSPAGKSEEAFKLAKKAGIERWAFKR